MLNRPTLNSLSHDEWPFIYPWTPGDRRKKKLALSTEFGELSKKVKLPKRQDYVCTAL